MVWFLNAPQRPGPAIKKFCVPDKCIRNTDCLAMKGKNYSVTGVYHSMGCKPIDQNHGQCVYPTNYIMPREWAMARGPRARPNYGNHTN